MAILHAHFSFGFAIPPGIKVECLYVFEILQVTLLLVDGEL
jgi:hypothetical protein